MRYINADKKNEDEIVETPNEKVPRKEPQPDFGLIKHGEMSNRQSLAQSEQ